MRKLLAITVLILLQHTSLCQEYTAQASLPEIKEDGFYRILITPKVAVYVNDNFSNIRLFDKDQREVPYLLNTDPVAERTAAFHEYTIEEKYQLEDSCTILVLSNSSGSAINNISLHIRNADVTKETSLSGSDDKENWYVLKENFFLSNINNTTGTSEIKIVDFPLSNYLYYRLWIKDKNSEPLNILNVGFYSTAQKSGNYFPVPVHTLIQKDTLREKKSYVRITFDTLRLMDNVEWFLSGSPFYLRNASVFTEWERTGKRGNKEKYLQHLSSIQLSSASKNIFYLPGIKVKNLVMVIENRDNPPLKVDSVAVNQLSRHITAWLEKGNVYTMKFGDDNFKAPSYDLTFFKDSIPAQVSFISLEHISPIVKDFKEASTPSIFRNRYVIWAAIIAVIALLLFMTIRLIRDANASEQK